MNSADISKLGLEEVELNIIKSKLDLKDLYYKNAINDLKDVSSIKKLRRTVARLFTRKNAIFQGDTNGKK